MHENKPGLRETLLQVGNGFRVRLLFTSGVQPSKYRSHSPVGMRRRAGTEISTNELQEALGAWCARTSPPYVHPPKTRPDPLSLLKLSFENSSSPYATFFSSLGIMKGWGYTPFVVSGGGN